MIEQVNHPKHYNSHPSGVECIDVIRHYTFDIGCAIKYLWRAGLKAELGKDDADKEIEDLNKALWYIDDYLDNCRVGESLRNAAKIMWGNSAAMDMLVEHEIGHKPSDIVKCYDKDVSCAMKSLMRIGLISNAEVLVAEGWAQEIKDAKRYIRRRIRGIIEKTISRDASDIVDMMNGVPVKGLHYATPGCNRQDEPEKYDPLNLIIINGTAYGLCDDVKKKGDGAVECPCNLCALRDDCDNDNGNCLCQLHEAADNEYYKDVGEVRYSPSFGTIEVYDEMKTMVTLKHEEESKEDK